MPLAADIMSPHRNRLMSVALARGLSYPDAEDAVQDVFAKALQSEVKLDETGSPRAWLVVILVNHIANLRRNANRQKRGGYAEHVELEPDMAICVDDPARLLELRWMRECLLSAGACYEQLMPSRGNAQSGRARVALSRLKKRLQPLLAHLRS